MAELYFITHPEVEIDPAIPVPDWTLSLGGRERMHGMLQQPWVRGLGSIWCSTERKAIVAAHIVGDAIGIVPCTLPGLGENDRSATGYLPRAEFEATADAFFAHPRNSVRGWETAADAQRRIVAAIETVLNQAPACRDIAVVSHGGVGTLYLCRLKACPISRLEDQPGTGGGNFYCFDTKRQILLHGWMPIDPNNC